MAYVYIQQHGASVVLALTDASAAALELLVTNRLSSGRAFVIDGISGDALQNPDLPVEEGQTANVLVSPGAHVVFTYADPQEDDLKEQLDLMHGSLENTNCIHLAQ